MTDSWIGQHVSIPSCFSIILTSINGSLSGCIAVRFASYPGIEARAIGDALQLLGQSFPVNRPLATVMQDTGVAMSIWNDVETSRNWKDCVILCVEHMCHLRASVLSFLWAVWT